MSGEYLSYIVTEVFCIVYAASILLRLRPEMGGKRELASLKGLLISYIVMLTTDIVWALVEGGTISLAHYWNAAANGISITAVALGCFFWFQFIEARLKPSAAYPKWVTVLTRIPVIFICALDLFSTFTGWVFIITPAGEYDEGHLFWMQSLICFAYLLFPTFHSLYEAIRTPLREKRKEYATYVCYIIIPSVLLLVVDKYATVPLFALSIFLVLQILFLTLYLDREHALAKMERELTESRTAVIVSQLQPHFLFNALTAIQDMCHGKAPEAEEAVVEFSEYLRGNVDSLRRSEPVSFEQELKHAKNYLALESKRFPGRVRAEYDIRATGFRLPVLTLQPIVENAVRYGITQREAGGTVRISSDEDGDAFRVTISDDGVGFDASNPKRDGRSHLGISSVRSRLETMCGGTLTMKSTPGIGTAAVISIPKKGRGTE